MLPYQEDSQTYFCPTFSYINKSPLKAGRGTLGAESTSWDPLPDFLRVPFSPVTIYARAKVPVTLLTGVVNRYQGAKE